MVMDVWGLKYFGVTTMTFWGRDVIGHVTTGGLPLSVNSLPKKV